MGQVFSNIWSCLCRKHRHDTPNTTHNDHLAQQQDHQSYYITIPDADIHQIPSTIPATVRRDFTPPVPTLVVDFNNDASQNQQRIVKKKKKEHQRQEVIPRVVEKQIVVKQDVIKKVPSVSKQTLVKTIGPFTNRQKILLVGEGDFSFSASLAVAFDSASNIIATSLNSHGFLIRNYRQFVTNKMKLESRGATVIHEIDVTAMVKDHVLGRLKFDRINYNFPHTGTFGYTNSDLRINQELIRGFLRNAKTMINKDGEILITHKCNYFFRKWDIPKLGSDEGLHLIEAVVFNQTIYPGYNTKYGFGGDKNFDCNPSKTYIFGLLPKSIRSTCGALFSEPRY